MASKASSTRSQSLRVQESDKTSTGSSKTKSTAAKGKENLKNPEKVSEKKNKIEKAPEVAGRPKREIKKTEKAKLLELEKIETKKGRKSTILSTDVEDSLSGEAESRKVELETAAGTKRDQKAKEAFDNSIENKLETLKAKRGRNKSKDEKSSGDDLATPEPILATSSSTRGRKKKIVEDKSSDGDLTAPEQIQVETAATSSSSSRGRKKKLVEEKSPKEDPAAPETILVELAASSTARGRKKKLMEEKSPKEDLPTPEPIQVESAGSSTTRGRKKKMIEEKSDSMTQQSSEETPKLSALKTAEKPSFGRGRQQQKVQVSETPVQAISIHGLSTVGETGERPDRRRKSVVQDSVSRETSLRGKKKETTEKVPTGKIGKKDDDPNDLVATPKSTVLSFPKSGEIKRSARQQKQTEDKQGETETGKVKPTSVTKKKPAQKKDPRNEEKTEERTEVEKKTPRRSIAKVSGKGEKKEKEPELSKSKEPAKKPAARGRQKTKATTGEHIIIVSIVKFAICF